MRFAKVLAVGVSLAIGAWFESFARVIDGMNALCG
jgi:hypothetical protein